MSNDLFPQPESAALAFAEARRRDANTSDCTSITALDRREILKAYDVLEAENRALAASLAAKEAEAAAAKEQIGVALAGMLQDENTSVHDLSERRKDWNAAIKAVAERLNVAVSTPAPLSPSRGSRPARLMGLTECIECGQGFEAQPCDRDICPECEEEYRLQNEENAREELICNALDCRCGAYGFTKAGQPYHAADCVCGRT